MRAGVGLVGAAGGFGPDPPRKVENRSVAVTGGKAGDSVDTWFRCIGWNFQETPAVSWKQGCMPTRSTKYFRAFFPQGTPSRPVKFAGAIDRLVQRVGRTDWQSVLQYPCSMLPPNALDWKELPVTSTSPPLRRRKLGKLGEA